MNNQEIKVLNKGFVRLVDSMGDDSSVVQAARVSYGKGTKTVNEDKALIRYLMRHKHTSPFEMVNFKFHIKCPIFVMRQLIRHRTAKVNEVSGRYSIVPDEFYVPEPDVIAKQSKNNKQGRGEVFSENLSKSFIEDFNNESETLFESYSKRIESGMAKELARINLPLSTYTEFYWQMDLHNLLHFLKLRLDPHAQYEIRVLSEAILDIITPIVPESVSAFNDYVLNSTTFSKKELDVLLNMIPNLSEQINLLNLDKSLSESLSVGELKEFISKLEIINV